MPAPPFRPRTRPGVPMDLFDQILERVHREVPAAVGLAVSVHPGDRAVLAARGIGAEFVDAQLRGSVGPVVDAAEHQVPVLSPDLDGDDRWPELALRAPVRGAAAVPGVWQADQTVVLSCALGTPADAATIATLIGYEQLLTAAMVATTARDGTRIADMLAVLQSRGAIEQAKGVVMGLLRCDADSAWATLRRASHESNVKLRVLAVALVEHIGGAPAEQPELASPIVPDEAARRAARILAAVLSLAPAPDPD